ncbi:uncharacterized protein LOC130591094 [Beta vulgaris subsp. vulgaris]|uniref:uncharacterized protein LOC130591094 n=1 Tax=Beta vulgaris subsp. vulgaris TaxID=3555 RepID=UPI002547F199|nr:uncharacterized protein LOC130591094 [Beta vulgaris subsp. vulgaris]
MCVPQDEELKTRILREAHCSPYSIHPGRDKLYKVLKKPFWWPRMKQEVADFVAKCLTCQKVKIQHMKPGGKLQPLEVQDGNGNLSLWIIHGITEYEIWKECNMGNSGSLTKTEIRGNEGYLVVEKLADAYFNEVVRLHGVPKDIVWIGIRDSYLSSGNSFKQPWVHY